MELANYLSHYFEHEFGPFLSICNLDADKISTLIKQESEAKTGFNRFSYGKDFFDYRKLADDSLIELYSDKFAKPPERRPFYGVLGDSDVVGGLYRDPYKIHIPIKEFEEHEITFMCPDHFHLVSLNKVKTKKHFGFQAPTDYSEEQYPYFGKLLTFHELKEKFHELKIDSYLEEGKRKNNWYRYVEAQIWSNPEDLRSRFTDWVEVDPEPWSHDTVTHLQNYKNINL